jgi:hypothetical protein
LLVSTDLSPIIDTFEFFLQREEVEQQQRKATIQHNDLVPSIRSVDPLD